MKAKLLFLAYMVSLFGYAQFDNIPTGTGYYINKIIVSPSGDDLKNEYIEVRGPANGTIPSTLWLVSIEGDGNSSSAGQVEEAIQLSAGGVANFGANGILSIVCNYTDDNGAAPHTDPETATTTDDVEHDNLYTSLIHSDAAVITIELTGGDVTSSKGAAVRTKTPDIGYDGNFIDASGNYMLINSVSNPKDIYIDGPNSGEAAALDGIIDSSGDHTSWILYDSVAYLDDNDEGDGEYGYSQIIFAQMNSTMVIGDEQYTTTTATVVDFNSSSDANFLFRQGSSTGHAAGDWVASGNGSGSVPNWEFSSTTSKVYPVGYAGWDEMNLYYGQLNPTEAAILSIESVTTSKFKIYPNPANDYIQIESKDIRISSVDMYSLVGEKVITTKDLVNSKLDISSLSSGIYILRVDAEGRSLNKKILVE